MLGVSQLCTGGVSQLCTGGVRQLCTGGVSQLCTGGVSQLCTGANPNVQPAGHLPLAIAMSLTSFLSPVRKVYKDVTHHR